MTGETIIIIISNLDLLIRSTPIKTVQKQFVKLTHLKKKTVLTEPKKKQAIKPIKRLNIYESTRIS